jgi:hypothetical protein
MQPCHNCGAVNIDAGGYCVNCRTFRATVYQEMPQGPDAYAYGTATGSPVSTSGAPYPTPDMYPTQPFQPPTSTMSAAGAERPPRRVPMASFVLVVGVLVIVTTALAVVLIRTNGGHASRAENAGSSPTSAAPSSPAPSLSPTPALAAGLDKCVVGTWLTTDAFIPLDDEGKVGLSTKSGAIYTLQPDGTGEVDYGSGVTFTGKVDGERAELLRTGRATFEYTTVGRAFNFTNLKGDIRSVLTVDNVVKGSAPLPLEAVTNNYACNGDSLTFEPAISHPTTLRRR